MLGSNWKLGSAGVDMQMGDGGALFCDSGYGVDC